MRQPAERLETELDHPAAVTAQHGDRQASHARLRVTAVVVGAMLNKLQVERGAAGDQVRVFLNEEQAQAWLKETK